MPTKEENKALIDNAVAKVTTAVANAITRITADITQAINDTKNGSLQVEDIQPGVESLNTLAAQLDSLDVYNPDQLIPPTE